MMSEGVLWHLPVARLEDVERKQRMRKEQSPGQRHDRYSFGQNDGCCHAAILYFSKISALRKGQPGCAVKNTFAVIEFQRREVVRATFGLRCRCHEVKHRRGLT